MKLNEIKNIEIYVNLFVHYQEAFNAYTISNSFNKYFMEHESLNCINNPKFHVMINSSPHSEDESIKIEITLCTQDYESIDKERLTINLKEFVTKYFNNQIKLIEVEYLNI